MKERIALVGSRLLNTTMALRFAESGAIVTLFVASEKTESLLQDIANEGVEIRLNSPVQTVEKIGNGKLKVTLRPSRRRSDRRPVWQTKYSTVNTAIAVIPGFSGGFLTEPQIKTGGVIDLPREGLSNAFDKVILTCDPKVAANLAPQLTAAEREILARDASELRSVKMSVDGLYFVDTSEITAGLLNEKEIIALAGSVVREIVR